MLDRFVVSLTVTIRPSRRDDLRDLEWFGLYAEARSWFEETFHRQEAGEVVILVAEANRFPVGQVLIDFTPIRAESVGVVSALRVLPCLQNLGIGTAPIRAGERVLRERGFAVAELGVCKENAGARRLYERHGYHVIGDNVESYAYPRSDGTVERGSFEEWILRKPLA